MADFSGLVRDLLAGVASPLVDSLKEDGITWQHCTGSDGRGGDTYSAAVPVRPLVNRDDQIARGDKGSIPVVIVTLTFVDPLTAVDPRDIFTLSDGSTGPILKTGGFTDPLTHQAYVTMIQLSVPMRGND